MKTSNSKLFRKLAINRRSNRISAAASSHVPLPTPILNWWKAKTIKDFK